MSDYYEPPSLGLSEEALMQIGAKPYRARVGFWTRPLFPDDLMELISQPNAPKFNSEKQYLRVRFVNPNPKLGDGRFCFVDLEQDRALENSKPTGLMRRENIGKKNKKERWVTWHERYKVYYAVAIQSDATFEASAAGKWVSQQTGWAIFEKGGTDGAKIISTYKMETDFAPLSPDEKEFGPMPESAKPLLTGASGHPIDEHTRILMRLRCHKLGPIPPSPNEPAHTQLSDLEAPDDDLPDQCGCGEHQRQMNIIWQEFFKKRLAR